MDEVEEKLGAARAPQVACQWAMSRMIRAVQRKAAVSSLAFAMTGCSACDSETDGPTLDAGAGATRAAPAQFAANTRFSPQRSAPGQRKLDPQRWHRIVNAASLDPPSGVPAGVPVEQGDGYIVGTDEKLRVIRQDSVPEDIQTWVRPADHAEGKLCVVTGTCPNPVSVAADRALAFEALASTLHRNPALVGSEVQLVVRTESSVAATPFPFHSTWTESAFHRRGTLLRPESKANTFLLIDDGATGRLFRSVQPTGVVTVPLGKAHADVERRDAVVAALAAMDATAQIVWLPRDGTSVSDAIERYSDLTQPCAEGLRHVHRLRVWVGTRRADAERAADGVPESDVATIFPSAPRGGTGGDVRVKSWEMRGCFGGASALVPELEASFRRCYLEALTLRSDQQGKATVTVSTAGQDLLASVWSVQGNLDQALMRCMAEATQSLGWVPWTVEARVSIDVQLSR